MAIGILTDGPTLCMTDTGAGHALENLGFTRNGVNHTSNGFFLPVPCDDNGGDDGPPADIQNLGETIDLEMEFTKFDEAVANKIRPRMYAGTLGQPNTPLGTPGGLMFSGGYTYRLVLIPTNRPLNFPQVVFQAPMQINKGTRFSTWILRATAYKNASGVLFNTTTT